MTNRGGDQANGQGPKAEEGLDGQIHHGSDQRDPIEMIQHEGQGADRGCQGDVKQRLQGPEQGFGPTATWIGNEEGQAGIEQIDGQDRGKRKLEGGRKEGQG